MCSVFKTDAGRAKTKQILGSVGEVFGVLVLHRVLTFDCKIFKGIVLSFVLFRLGYSTTLYLENGWS